MGSPGGGPRWDARVVAVATIWVFSATIVAWVVMPAWRMAPRAWIVFALLGVPAWAAGELAARGLLGGSPRAGEEARRLARTARGPGR